MPNRLRTITVDAADPYAQAQFWAKVTGYAGDPEEPDAPGDDEVLLVDPAGGPNLLFVRVPEGKVVKNRVHLDVEPFERTRDAEVERLLELGATQVADFRRPDGLGWVTLADPEGNEFCVERSAQERAAAL